MSINIIIPLAGDGTRFKNKNFSKPKPLIKVFKKTLIEISIRSLNLKNANFFFVIIDIGILLVKLLCIPCL